MPMTTMLIFNKKLELRASKNNSQTLDVRYIKSYLHSDKHTDCSIVRSRNGFNGAICSKCKIEHKSFSQQHTCRVAIYKNWIKSTLVK